MKSTLTCLECSRCGKEFDDRIRVNLCSCGGSLLARYDPPKLDRETFGRRPKGMWRWFEMLPVRDPGAVVTLGEGDTPLLEVGEHFGVKRLWIKDEALNPTGSFKARGMAAAISKARELGVKRIGVPTAGNAGGAAACYGARAGIEVFVFVPEGTPEANVREAEAAGAKVTFVKGSIADAGRELAARREELGVFDVSTLKEPYRHEGKKILAYEIAEALGWELPEVLVFPTGGGTGVIGIWKALQEMRAMSWIGDRLPRIIAVQTEGCAPIVKAIREGADRCEAWPDPVTEAAGLRVPKPYADHLVLKAIRDSGGTAVAVSEQEIRDAKVEMNRLGVQASPEGAACLPALREIKGAGSVVIFNTASGLKYA